MLHPFNRIVFHRMRVRQNKKYKKKYIISGCRPVNSLTKMRCRNNNHEENQKYA